MDRQQKFKIEKKLIGLPFVQWDRYINSTNAITIFGWVNREDNYKDFVIVEFNTDNYEVNVWNTSSLEYSKEISKIFEPFEEHNDCHRVEHYFNIKNCTKLKDKE